MFVSVSFSFPSQKSLTVTSMVLIKDGNSEHDSHAWRDICPFGEKNPICDCSLSYIMP